MLKLSLQLYLFSQKPKLVDELNHVHSVGAAVILHWMRLIAKGKHEERWEAEDTDIRC
jgi:hypothetical protein